MGERQPLKYGIKTHEDVIELFDRITSNDPTLTSLRFTGHVLDSDALRVLASILHLNTHLEELDMSEQPLISVEFDALAEALKRNATLKKITLGCDGLLPVEDLADMLADNRGLLHLDAYDVRVGTEQALVLARALETNATLRVLKLRVSGIRDEQVCAFAGALRKNRSLEELHLQSNLIGGEGVAAIAEALKHNNTLTTLSLAFNECGSCGATALAAALEQNNALRSLDMHGCAVTFEGVADLARALKTNTALETVCLYGIWLEDDEKKKACKEMVEAIKCNPSLKRLQMFSVDHGTLQRKLDEHFTPPALCLRETTYRQRNPRGLTVKSAAKQVF